MIYLAFTAALAFACFAALEYFYVMFLETRNRQQERRIAQLERQNANLKQTLHTTRNLLDEYAEPQSEMWSEILDDDR